VGMYLMEGSLTMLTSVVGSSEAPSSINNA
jgi:hypothetical protein